MLAQPFDSVNKMLPEATGFLIAAFFTAVETFNVRPKTLTVLRNWPDMRSRREGRVLSEPNEWVMMSDQ